MTARTDPDAAAKRSESASRAPTWVARSWRVIKEAIAICLRYRVTGLAAEAAFFAVLSLPPLIFGLVGAVGFVTATLDIRTIANFRDQLIELSSRALTADVVQNVVEPTLDDVLLRGSAAVISVGFLIALWAGSRAMNVFVDTITIMYGMAGKRSIVRTRTLSFALYLAFLFSGIVLLPLILAGPTLVHRVLPPSLEILSALYWPVVLLGSVCMLAALYHLSVPVRSRWRSELPGAAVTMAIWLIGSVLLRLVLTQSVGSPTIYGPLAAPIAFLIWLYVISIAVLIGAAFNSSLDEFFPRLSGIDHKAVPADQETPTDQQNPTDQQTPTQESSAKKAPLRQTLAGVRARFRRKSQ